MASVSGRYNSGTTGIGTANAQAQPAHWSYAVPPDDAAASGAGAPPDDYNTTDSTSNPAPRQPLSNHVNGTQRPSTGRKTKPMPSLDTEYATSGAQRPAAAQLIEHGDLSATNSEPDSLVDLYRPSKEHFKSASSRRKQVVRRKGSLGADSSLSEAGEVGEAGDQESKWIHRDKLAQIESREMMEMGIAVNRRPSRSRSHTGTRATKPTSVDIDSEPKEDRQVLQDAKRQRTVSPTFSSGEVTQPDVNQALSYNQTVAQDEPATRPRAESHRRRPSASKIPVTKGIAAAESSSPTSASAAARGASALATSPTSTSSPQSPSKSKLPNKTTPKSATRPGVRGGRSTSGQSRPGTSNGGTPSRPSTSGGRAPEGDPPWVASMFKPDPRLPPDQQMLPTHAKRLAQQQGLPEPMMYETSRPEDADFMLLDNDESESGSPTQADESSVQAEDRQRELQLQQDVPPQAGSPHKNFHYREPIEHNSSKGHQVASAEHYEGDTHKYSPGDHESNEWPLKSPHDRDTFQREPSSPKTEVDPSAARNGRSGTPVREPGYSLMPNIHRNKEMEQRLSQRSGLSNSSSVPGATPAAQPIRVPEDPEPEPTEKEAKKKKSCAACCIVM